MRVPTERPGRRRLHRQHTRQPADTGRESVSTRALGHSTLLDWKSMANSLRPKGMGETVNADDGPRVKSVASAMNNNRKPPKKAILFKTSGLSSYETRCQCAVDVSCDRQPLQNRVTHVESHDRISAPFTRHDDRRLHRDRLKAHRRQPAALPGNRAPFRRRVAFSVRSGAASRPALAAPERQGMGAPGSASRRR
ncbi:transposase (plasmid) [Ralstonia solanacearum]|nr:transposase [Ralstonia solanacearum]